MRKRGRLKPTQRYEMIIAVAAVCIATAFIVALAGMILHNLGIGDVATTFAILAVVVALITLYAVLEQIKIANDQYDLSREELDAVKEDIANNKILFAKALKHSQLWMYGLVVNYPDRSGNEGMYVRARLYNDGDKVDTLYTVTFGIHGSFGEPVLKDWEETWHPEGDLYAYAGFRFYTYNGTKPVYKKDFINLPEIELLGKFDRTNHNTLIMYSISTIYERNPEERYWYYVMQDSQTMSPASKRIYTLKRAGSKEPFYITERTFDGKNPTLQQLIMDGLS